MFRTTLTGLMAGALATTLACGPSGSPPELDALSDQVATVGRELVIEIRATDPDGDDLEFDFSSVVPEIKSRAQMTKRPDGSGLFRWTPQASDVNPGWAFDFTVSDGDSTDTVTIQIEVKSDVGQAGAPIFREPLGTGTTLDLNITDCIDVDIVIEDADTAAVTLTELEPRIPGARLSAASNGLSGTWTWCPTREQIDEDDRWTLTLSADDGSSEPTIKRYLIVLRKPPKEDCPGNPPVITHTPADESTLLSLAVFADVTDDAGLKAEPLLYYSTTPPATPPDLGQMTQVSMILIDGDMRNGTWGADVPNPVVDQPAGSSATLHYVIVATDNDDLDGSCDHLTQAPTSGAFSMTVTNPGGEGGAGVCEPCTSDVQCGGASDLCVRIGDMAESFCTRACAGPSDCPADYTCSASPVTSVNGASSRQCVPNSSSCEDPGGGACVDDAFEDNDSRTEADANPALAPGSYDAVSCDAGAFTDDEDFYRIDITEDSQVTVSISGGSQSDLDLALQNDDGSIVKNSVSLTSTEEVTECLEPGTYYIRVYAFSAEQNPYSLTYSRTAMSCGGEPACSDDELEDNDTQGTATAAEVFPNPFTAETMAMCAEDDDWFELDLFTGETVYVDLTFEQSSVSEDLDLHFHDAAGTDLTPCEEDNPITCTSDQGQSATSNEHFEREITEADCAPCTFYVRVHGWNGAENLYDLRIGLEPVATP